MSNPTGKMLARILGSVAQQESEHKGERRRARWDAASPDIRGKVVDELMVITVLPTRRGRREFDPDLILIEPKA
jgi:DNA invertase Pin-like site-specific DNA recombinase